MDTFGKTSLKVAGVGTLGAIGTIAVGATAVVAISRNPSNVIKIAGAIIAAVGANVVIHQTVDAVCRKLIDDGLREAGIEL